MPRLFSPASQQILDRAIGAQDSVGATSFDGDIVDGTVFPLLPNQAVRIYNASGQVFAAVPGKINLQALNLYVQFYDATGAKVNAPTVLLAAENYANPGALMNGSEGGSCIAADGDPLIEIVSGMFVTGVLAANGPALAAFSVSGSFEVFNTDSGAHNVNMIMSALLSFTPLRT